jgi:hypothetical protein
MSLPETIPDAADSMALSRPVLSMSLLTSAPNTRITGATTMSAANTSVSETEMVGRPIFVRSHRSKGANITASVIDHTSAGMNGSAIK